MVFMAYWIPNLHKNLEKEAIIFLGNHIHSYFKCMCINKTVINIFISSNGSICKIPAPALEYYLKTCDDQEFVEADITFK